MSKISIRFYKDHKVRAVWDEEKSQWWFSILDIVGAINEQDDHEKNRNYWKYIKAKLRKEQSEVVSDTTQLKLTASDGKKYNTDVISLAEYLHDNLKTIEQMPETTFDEIVDKYVEMNVAHPFMEGNGRSTRIWLDLIFKKRLGQCVDWSKIDKKDYLDAMIASHMDSTRIRELLRQAMTDKINDREIFMKGIDYSYYYEQED